MCIISLPVERVNATKIFSCFTEDEGRQFVIYSNQVTTDEDYNMMILPVPNPASVDLINLNHYPNFFEDCQKNFYYSTPRQDYNTRSMSASFDRYERPPLPVYNVGSYVASIVPSVSDFDRLNPRHFPVSSDLRQILGRQYDSEFGFICCRLKSGNHTYHPFAYSHDRHTSRLLFIPTFHYHPHDVGSVRHVDADWDHVIYTVGTDFDSTYMDNYRFSPSVDFKIHKLPVDVRWIRKYKMSRWTKTGSGKNRDIWVAGNVYNSLERSISPPSRSRYVPVPQNPDTGSRTSRSFSPPSNTIHFSEEGIRRLQKYFNP
jgi:hypothetical protein